MKESSHRNPNLQPSSFPRPPASSPPPQPLLLQEASDLLPRIPMALDKMTLSELEAWIQIMKKEHALYGRLSVSFSKAAESIASKKGKSSKVDVGAVPPNVLMFIQQRLGRPFDSATTTGEEYLDISMDFLSNIIKLQGMLHEARQVKMDKLSPQPSLPE